MHNHDQHGMRMMWLMMLACALPLVITSFASAGTKTPVTWAVIGLGLMLLFHWIIMRKHHHQTPETKDIHREPTQKHQDHTQTKDSP